MTTSPTSSSPRNTTLPADSAVSSAAHKKVARTSARATRITDATTETWLNRQLAKAPPLTKARLQAITAIIAK